MSDKKQTFGQWLRSKRQSRKLSQQELANRTGGAVSKPYISLLENDRPNSSSGAPPSPSKETLAALAKGLHVPLAEIAQAAGWDIGGQQSDEQESEAQSYSRLRFDKMKHLYLLLPPTDQEDIDPHLQVVEDLMERRLKRKKK